jgi:lysozyme
MEIRMATQVSGLDVSHYQGNVNWATVKSSGAAFAFIKASEGTSIKDSMFATNWAGTKTAGLLRGAYHFFRASQDATAQANFFLGIVNFASGDLPPVIDVEVTDNASNDQLQSGIQTWLQVVTAATGVTPIIYAGPSFWNQHLTPQFGSYPLWVANYGVASPKLPNGWSSWQFWQYSQSGSIAGVSGPVDMDYFNGTLDQLMAFSNSPAETVSTTPPAAGDAPVTYTVQPGDTLSGIAAAFGTTVNALASANGIQNVNLIQVGQVLQIPQGD